MNIKKVKTGLPGYEGPFFPPEIEELQNILAYIGYNPYEENFPQSIIPNFQSAPSVAITEDDYVWRLQSAPSVAITEDDYVWRLGIIFKTLKGKIAILFPGPYRCGKKENPKPDRSIATYTQGEVSEAEIQFLFLGLILELLSIREKQIIRGMLNIQSAIR